MMKKALNVTSIIIGIASLVLGLMGLVALIMTIAQIGFYSFIIPSLIVILLQLAAGALFIVAVKKGNAIMLLAVAIVALVLVILDLFVGSTAGMVMCSGSLWAGIFSSLAMITVFEVIGYIVMAAFVLIIALQVYDMIKNK